MGKDPVRDTVKKSVEEINEMINERFIFNLENYHIPEIQSFIMQDYDIELVGRVTDRRSKTNPRFYREEFESALERFEWIDYGTGFTKLITPELNTFNWNQGRLRIIEQILEGSVGAFIEVDEEQYVAMFDKRPIIQPFDKAVPLKERIYLLRLTGDIRRRWRETFPKDGWVIYPFSNQAPIDIFGNANTYIENNMQDWINETIKEVTKEVR